MKGIDMKIGRVMKFAVPAIVLLLTPVVSNSIPAQQGSQTNIGGIVRDQNGDAVSGAEVSLVHSQAVLKTTLTGADGKFVLDNVKPGNYAIRVTRSGFGQYSSVVQVTPGDKKELSVELEINPLSEEVSVTAEAGQVSDARGLAQPVNVIDEREILERGTEVVAQV